MWFASLGTALVVSGCLASLFQDVCVSYHVSWCCRHYYPSSPFWGNREEIVSYFLSYCICRHISSGWLLFHWARPQESQSLQVLNEKYLVIQETRAGGRQNDRFVSVTVYTFLVCMLGIARAYSFWNSTVILFFFFFSPYKTPACSTFRKKDYMISIVSVIIM